MYAHQPATPTSQAPCSGGGSCVLGRPHRLWDRLLPSEVAVRVLLATRAVVSVAIPEPSLVTSERLPTEVRTDVVEQLADGSLLDVSVDVQNRSRCGG